MRKATLISLALVSLLMNTAGLQAAVLESPAAGAVLSGLGFISGWKCHAGTITVVIDENGEHLSVAMHQERGDLRAAGVCGGTINHGFIMQINWALLGAGEHVVVAYDDGVEFARHTFSVGTTGEEFLKDVARRTVLEDFPTPGKQALLEWNESTQHFEIVTVWGDELPEYDQAYWRQYDADLAEGTYREAAFLYAEEPDVDACFAGRLTQAAKNRALEAMNQIRALHGVPPVQYSSRYDRQMQEASLIQAANRFLSHHSEPSAQCYTEAGAAGSGTSNIAGSTLNGQGTDQDPAYNIVGWTNDANNLALVAAAGHRRWVLNPFAAYVSYGQVQGYAAQKVFGFDDEPHIIPRIEVDYVAFPYETYPFHLVEGDPPWSFSVIEDPDTFWNNRSDYFRGATITVTRVEDGTELLITDRYTDTQGMGVPNLLSWQVQNWQYDTLYEVEIENVLFSDGRSSDYSYAVFIERDSLEQ